MLFFKDGGFAWWWAGLIQSLLRILSQAGNEVPDEWFRSLALQGYPLTENDELPVLVLGLGSPDRGEGGEGERFSLGEEHLGLLLSLVIKRYSDPENPVPPFVDLEEDMLVSGFRFEPAADEVERPLYWGVFPLGEAYRSKILCTHADPCSPFKALAFILEYAHDLLRGGPFVLSLAGQVVNMLSGRVYIVCLAFDPRNARYPVEIRYCEV